MVYILCMNLCWLGDKKSMILCRRQLRIIISVVEKQLVNPLSGCFFMVIISPHFFFEKLERFLIQYNENVMTSDHSYKFEFRTFDAPLMSSVLQ